MINEKIDKMVAALPEFMKRYTGISDENNEILNLYINTTMHVFELLKDAEYVSDIHGIPVVLSDSVHEYYVNTLYPNSGLSNQIPMTVCVGPGLVDPIDNFIVINTKYCELDHEAQVFGLLHELGHILVGDTTNELAADRYACQCMEEGVGKRQLEKFVRYVEDACGNNPQYHGYVESVKMRLNFV